MKSGEKIAVSLMLIEDNQLGPECGTEASDMRCANAGRNMGNMDKAAVSVTGTAIPPYAASYNACAFW